MTIGTGKLSVYYVLRWFEGDGTPAEYQYGSQLRQSTPRYETAQEAKDSVVDSVYWRRHGPNGPEAHLRVVKVKVRSKPRVLYTATNETLEDVRVALAYAREQHPKPMASAHEGFAVMLEEVDELWAEIMANNLGRRERMREEALQIGAMALRFVEDVCDK